MIDVRYSREVPYPQAAVLSQYFDLEHLEHVHPQTALKKSCSIRLIRELGWSDPGTVDHSCQTVADGRVQAHVRSLLVEPAPILRDWDYGKPGVNRTRFPWTSHRLMVG